MTSTPPAAARRRRTCESPLPSRQPHSRRAGGGEALAAAAARVADGAAWRGRGRALPGRASVQYSTYTRHQSPARHAGVTGGPGSESTQRRRAAATGTSPTTEPRRGVTPAGAPRDEAGRWASEKVHTARRRTGTCRGERVPKLQLGGVPPHGGDWGGKALAGAGHGRPRGCGHTHGRLRRWPPSRVGGEVAAGGRAQERGGGEHHGCPCSGALPQWPRPLGSINGAPAPPPPPVGSARMTRGWLSGGGGGERSPRIHPRRAPPPRPTAGAPPRRRRVHPRRGATGVGRMRRRGAPHWRERHRRWQANAPRERKQQTRHKKKQSQ